MNQSGPATNSTALATAAGVPFEDPSRGVSFTLPNKLTMAGTEAGQSEALETTINAKVVLRFTDEELLHIRQEISAGRSVRMASGSYVGVEFTSDRS